MHTHTCPHVLPSVIKSWVFLWKQGIYSVPVTFNTSAKSEWEKRSRKSVYVYTHKQVNSKIKAQGVSVVSCRGFRAPRKPTQIQVTWDGWSEPKKGKRCESLQFCPNDRLLCKAACITRLRGGKRGGSGGRRVGEGAGVLCFCSLCVLWMTGQECIFCVSKYSCHYLLESVWLTFKQYFVNLLVLFSVNKSVAPNQICRLTVTARGEKNWEHKMVRHECQC